MRGKFILFNVTSYILRNAPRDAILDRIGVLSEDLRNVQGTDLKQGALTSFNFSRETFWEGKSVL